MHRHILICCFSLVFTLSALSQDDATNLNPTVVEATSPARKAIQRKDSIQQALMPKIDTATPPLTISDAAEVPSFLEPTLPSVDTLSATDIRVLQRRDLTDVLRQSAGLHLVQTGQMGAQSSLFIRGMESNHTVVMLDGRRLPPGLGGMYQLESLDVSTLESVQLLRGAASSLYGSDALAGAIDLRSTDARYVESDTLESYAEGGSFDTFRMGHKLTLRDGRASAALDTSWLTTANDRPFSDYENRVLRGSFAYDLGEGAFLDVLGYIQNSDLQVPGSRLSPTFPESQLNHYQTSLFSPRFSVTRDEWDFSLLYSYTKSDLEATKDVFFNDSLLKQWGHELEAVFHWHPDKSATYTLGAGYYSYGFERIPLIPGFFNPAAEFDYGYTSIFAQAEMNLPANFHLVVGGRHDEQDSFTSKPTWSVQLDYTVEPTGTVLFAKAATGYKAPSGQDFIYLAPTVLPSTLAPEESFTREFGLRQTIFNPRSSISATYFENKIDNLIDVDPFTFVNPAIVDTESSGVELETVLSPTENLSFYVNATWLDAHVLRGQYLGGFGGNPGDRLPRRPEFALAGGVVYSGDGWKLGAELSGAYKRLDTPGVILDDYTVARIFGSYEINDQVEIYGRIENLFDHDYETTRGFDAAGLGAFAGVRILWGK